MKMCMVAREVMVASHIMVIKGSNWYDGVVIGICGMGKESFGFRSF
jgi:hypothetical protein